MKLYALNFGLFTLNYLGDTTKNLPDLYQNIMNLTRCGVRITLITDISEEVQSKIRSILAKIDTVNPEADDNFGSYVRELSHLTATLGTLGDDFDKKDLTGLTRAWYQIAMQGLDASREKERQISKLKMEIMTLKSELTNSVVRF